MRKTIIILSTVFAVICVALTAISPDYLSMLVVGVMGVAVALGFVFSLVPLLLYSGGFKNGQLSIDRAKEINADYIWTAVQIETPFFRQRNLDQIFDSYLESVKEERDKGVVISDIEDVINEEALSLLSWRGVVLQIAGMLTALGLLGTFLGLVTGISSVSFGTAEATIESIENLLRGIATAFYTSIVGVILSILFNVAYRLVWNIAIREMNLFIDRFHAQIQLSVDEQIRAKQYLNTERMIETLEVIRTNSSLNLSQKAADPAQEQRMMIDIISGLKRGEFTFSLEPVCGLSDRNILKAESKLRWNHSVLGTVQPSVYLPIVESDGFIAKLDVHMWEEVLKTVKGWVRSGSNPVPVILDVRKTDLLALDVDETISSLLDKYDLDPRNIEIAIDASTYVICNEEAIKAERAFIEKGIRISVSNFDGNFVGLGATRADEVYLNIDLVENPDDVESIFRQAQNTHINLICGGVSSAKQLADIKKYGCLYGKGEHLYPEMTRYEFAKLMQYPAVED